MNLLLIEFLCYQPMMMMMFPTKRFDIFVSMLWSRDSAREFNYRDE